MKKILKTNAIIILLFATLLIFLNFKNQDTTYWRNWGQSENSQPVYLHNTGLSGNDMYAMLASLAKETEVNIIKTDYLVFDGNETIVKSVFIGNSQDNIFKDSSIVNGTYITENDNSKNMFVSTKNNDNSLCSGVIFDFLNDDYVEVWTLNRFMSERGNLDGDYTIRAENNQKISSFITELSKRSGIDSNDLIQQKTFVSVVESPIKTMVIVATVISLLVFALLCIYYAINSSKKIGVMKLNGYKNFDIWKELTLSIFSTIVISAMVIDIVMLFAIKNNSLNFMINVIGIDCVVIALLCLSSILIYWIIKKNIISNLLKNKAKVKPIIILTQSIKSIILLILVVLSVLIGSGLKQAGDEFTKMKNWEDVSDLAVLVNLDIGNDAASIKQGSIDLDKDFASYYTYLENSGAIYANVYTLNPHVQFKTKFNEDTGTYRYVDYFNASNVPQNFTSNTFQINQNYLNAYPIKDINGKDIKVENTSDRLILVPETMKSEISILEDVYKAEYIDSIKSAEKKQGIIEDSIPDVNLKIIFYEESQKEFFAFSTSFEESNYSILSPIFEVLTNENMTLLEKSNIYIQGINSPLKVNLHGKSSGEFNQNIQKSLETYNLDDNNLKYMSIGEVFANQINSLKSICRQYTVALLIIFIIMTMITIYLTKLVMEVKKKMYCVKKLYGYTFIDRFKGILIFNVITDLIITIISIIIGPSLMQVSISLMSIGIIFAMILLDVCLICIIMKYFENKNISQLVKGE